MILTCFSTQQGLEEEERMVGLPGCSGQRMWAMTGLVYHPGPRRGTGQSRLKRRETSGCLDRQMTRENPEMTKENPLQRRGTKERTPSLDN